jgi:hypothetical protein
VTCRGRRARLPTSRFFCVLKIPGNLRVRRPEMKLGWISFVIGLVVFVLGVFFPVTLFMPMLGMISQLTSSESRVTPHVSSTGTLSVPIAAAGLALALLGLMSGIVYLSRRRKHSGPVWPGAVGIVLGFLNTGVWGMMLLVAPKFVQLFKDLH